MSVRELRVVVLAGDYESAVRFYRDALGLVEQEAVAGPGGAAVTILDAGRATLELANPAQHAYIDEVEVGRPAAPAVRLAFEVDDVTRVTAALVDAGGAEVAPPTPTPFGSVNARLDAPAGLQVTVFERTAAVPVGDPAGGGAAVDGGGVDGGGVAADGGGDGRGNGAGPDAIPNAGRNRPAGATAGGALVVRDAAAGDWAAVWPFFREIVAAGETYTWPRDMSEDAARAAWFPSPGRTVVAVLDGAVVGSAKTQPNQAGAGAHVANASFMVDPAYGGRGIGRALGEHVLTQARADGYRAMQFNAVVASNAGAVRLWSSLGFTVVGSVPGAFDHPRLGPVPLLIMYRRLVP